MEHGNNLEGGEPQQPPICPAEESQEQGAGRSELARQVDAAIEAARHQERSIDDLTAKRIAADIQSGSGALHDFAATGTISEDIYTELDVAREVLPENAHTWLAAFEDYCLGRRERGPVAGWADLESVPSTDDQRIYHGITEALLAERPIDHGTARAIAVHLHGGEVSALCALASTGALVDGLQDELDAWRQRADTPVEVEPWLDALAEYIDHREDREPVTGWHQLWAPEPEREGDEPGDGDEERPPHGNTRSPGQGASGAVVEQHRDRDIPTLETYPGCDGYEWMERLPPGWRSIASWGLNGWDLARWPYSIVVMFDDPGSERYAFGIYTEGDITVMRCPTEAELYASIDDLAEWYWRNGVALGPEDLPKGSGSLPHHRGPFSWVRLRRWERAQERHGHAP